MGRAHRSHRARPLHRPVDTAPNGSGDSTAGWLQLALLVALSLVATVVWSVADRRRTDYPRLRQWLHVYLRFAVGTIMIGYGLAKVYHSQFPFPSPAKLEQPYGDASPMGLLWTFMGFSGSYNVFTGLAETVPALLLFFRRTATLGSDRARRGHGQRRGAQLLLRRAGQYLLDRADASVAVYRGAAFARALRCAGCRARRRRAVVAAAVRAQPRLELAARLVAVAFACYLVGRGVVQHERMRAAELQRANEPRRRATREFRLLTRGFHWVNESPYNRFVSVTGSRRSRLPVWPSESAKKTRASVGVPALDGVGRAAAEAAAA